MAASAQGMRVYNPDFWSFRGSRGAADCELIGVSPREQLFAVSTVLCLRLFVPDQKFSEQRVVLGPILEASLPFPPSKKVLE